MNAAAQPLDADARARCAVAAALLHGGRVGGALALLAAAAWLVLMSGRGAPSGPPAAAAVLLLFVERYAALRVALDGRLFSDLAAGRCADLATLDGALQQVLRVPAAKAGRPLDDRIRGAQRLLRLQLLATGGLWLLVLWAWRG